jgi:hypothetical protein
MVTCPICAHAKIDAIHAALDAKRRPAMVARAFRVPPDVLEDHIRHRFARAQRSMPLVNSSSQAGIVIPARAHDLPQVTENPFSQFKQAWALAKDDPRLRAQMVSWLNDQLRANDEVPF